MRSAAGRRSRSAVPGGFWQSRYLRSSSPLAMAKPVLLCSPSPAPSNAHRERTWAPGSPRGAPVIYFFNREQQQRVISGIWKRCAPVQGSLPNLDGSDLIKPRACVPAQPSTDIRIFSPPPDAGCQATRSPRVPA